MTKVKKICEVCGKPFLVKPSEKNARFCSQKCVAKWRSEFRSGENSPRWRGRVKRICEICENTFLVKPWEIKRGRGRFCSRTCYIRYLTEHEKGKNNHHWKGGRVKRTCEMCGAIFLAELSALKKGYDRFCSKECWYKWRSINIRKEKVYNWKGGLVNRICPICGSIFHRPPSVIKTGAGKYCSLSCARRAKVYPTHHTKPELIFEEICKKYNLPFKYTGDGSFWIGKKPSVNPDFVECNGKKIAVEIFGDYWHSPLLNPKLREDRTLYYRQKALKKYGWKLIVFWESDLSRKDAEQFVLNKLKKEVWKS